MPAGSFQQETRELATACWDPQAEEDHPTSPKMEDLPIQQIREETLKIKRVHWNSKLASTHDIEAVGEQKPTSALLRKQQEQASIKRTCCTNRSSRYRNQLVNVVTTLYQLHAINTNTEPQCPRPRLLYDQPRITILQNPEKPKYVIPPRRVPKGNEKPLSQRQAEYAQHRSRIFNYKLRPGVFNATFFPP